MAAAEAIVQTPVALLGTLFTVPGGVSAALTAAPLLGRNFPLVLLLVMIGALFWPTQRVDDTERVEDAEAGVRTSAKAERFGGDGEHLQALRGFCRGERQQEGSKGGEGHIEGCKVRVSRRAATISV